jgi:hypothetical protein
MAVDVRKNSQGKSQGHTLMESSGLCSHRGFGGPPGARMNLNVYVDETNLET